MERAITSGRAVLRALIIVTAYIAGAAAAGAGLAIVSEAHAATLVAAAGMARRLTTATLAASPNVVRLPTAAPRRINNTRYRQPRRAAQVERKAQPWPGETLLPAVREAVQQ